MEKDKEIIYLEPDEEITSIIDKLKSFEDVKSVFLVAPKNASITQSVVNLKILKKEAEKLGIDIAFVTNDPIGQNLSFQVGIPLYESINAEKPMMGHAKLEPVLNETIEIDMTEKNHEKLPKVQVNYYNPENAVAEHKNPVTEEKAIPEPVTHSAKSPISAQNYIEPTFTKPAKPKKWILKFAIALVVLGVGFLGYNYYAPKAYVNLILKSEAISENIQMTVDTSVKVSDPKTNTIPGEILNDTAELNKSFTATGLKDIGEKAHGTVTLSNQTGSVTSVDAGNQVESSGGLIFVTDVKVTVPAATASVDGDGNVVKNPGTVEVNVTANNSGDNYNIGPTNFSVINHPNLSGSNSSNFAGGTSQKVTIISQDDLDKASADLENDVKNTAKDDLLKKAQDSQMTLLSDAIDYSDKTFTPANPAGTEASSFDASLKINAKTIAFKEDDYKNNIIAALGDQIPKDKELVLSADDKISQDSFSVDYIKGTLKIDGTIKTKLAPKIDEDAIKNAIKGKSLISAQNYFNGISNIKSFTIDFKSSIMKNIPSRTQNISITKAYQVQ